MKTKAVKIKVLMDDGRKIKLEAESTDTIGDIVECIVRKIENEH